MLEPARHSDEPLIVDVAREVYAHLGDYGQVMPSWFSHPDVQAFVDRRLSDILAFCLVGYFEPLGSARRLVVDVLALGVAPKEQRQGRGRRLLRHVIGEAHKKAAAFQEAEMRLTVSQDNTAASKLFSSEGFSILDLHHGQYDRGQPAIRMRRPL